MSMSRTIAHWIVVGVLCSWTVSQAQAAFISTAGAGFLPATFDGSGTQSLSIDLNGDGTTDFTISGSYVDPSFSVGAPVTIVAGANSVYLNGNQSNRTVAFPDTNFASLPSYTTTYPSTGFQSGNAIIGNLPQGGYSLFHFVGPNANNAGQHIGFIEVELLDVTTSALTLGYIGGTFFDGTTASRNAYFTVTDFGIASDVPEPGSILMVGGAILALVAKRRAA